MPGQGRVTDSSSPHRKWATARREEPAAAWRLRALVSRSDQLAFPFLRHGKGRQCDAAAPRRHGALALAALLRHGLGVQGSDSPLGCEVARDPAAAGDQVGASWSLCRSRRGGRARKGLGARWDLDGSSDAVLAPLLQVLSCVALEASPTSLPPRAQLSCAIPFPPAVRTLPCPRFLKLRGRCLIRLDCMCIYYIKKEEEWVMESGV